MRNKVLSGLLALVISFGLWLYVITFVSYNDENTFYNIPVVFEGEAVLHDRGLMLSGKEDTTITLVLSGSRSDLAKVDSSNITVKASLAGIYGPGENIELNYNISYPGDVPSNAFVEESRNPETVKVSVEKLVSNKEIPVVVRYNGTSVPEGFMCDKENAELDHDVVLISGPGSVADLISQAVVEVDLTEQRESISQNYRYTLCDGEGNAVDAQSITTNVEEVRLDVKIRRVKEVELKLDVTYAGGATTQNTIVEINPAKIRLSGGEAVLEELGDSILLGKINLADVFKSGSQTFTINLPEGVTNETGVTEAEVTITFTGLATKEFVIENIKMMNVPDGMEAELITERLPITVRGPAATISKLTADDIYAVVDFTGAEADTATFKAVIVFNEDFATVGALGTYTVSATVNEK